MNIHAPVKVLNKINIYNLLNELPPPEDILWNQGDFRNQEIAYDSHSKSRNIIRRHEWFNRNGIPEMSLTEALDHWRSGYKNPYPFSQCTLINTTSLCSVYVFPIRQALDSAIDNCIKEAVEPIETKNGVVTRAMITALPPGSDIPAHRDLGLTTRFAHRIHIALAGNEGVIYRIGSHHIKMEPGIAYDFNNSWRHSVLNAGDQWRINLIIDYLENSGTKNPWLHLGWRP
jgi:hypothetical protein